MEDMNSTDCRFDDDGRKKFQIVYLRSSTISRTALLTRASTWTVLLWLSPSGERPSSLWKFYYGDTIVGEGPGLGPPALDRTPSGDPGSVSGTLGTHEVPEHTPIPVAVGRRREDATNPLAR